MGSPVAVDDWTAWAIGAIELSDESEVNRWCMVLAEAEGEAQDWDTLAERIREGAGQAGFDQHAVETFLQSMADTGQGVELVQSVVALGDQVPGLYFALKTHASGEAEHADPWGWLRHDHRATLHGKWGESWAEYLQQQLEYRWGSDWHSHPDEHKAAWFEDLLPQLTGPEPEADAEAEAHEDQVSSALTEAMAEVHGAAELSEQELAEVMAEVRACLQSTTQEATP